MPLEIVESPDCPIRVLDKYSRLTCGGEPGTTAGTQDDSLTSNDYRVVLDLAFRNASAYEVVEASFRWEGLDLLGDAQFDRPIRFDGRVPSNSGARLAFESAFDPARGEGDYRLTVQRVELADGTVWVAPESDDDPS